VVKYQYRVYINWQRTVKPDRYSAEGQKILRAGNITKENKKYYNKKYKSCPCCGNCEQNLRDLGGKLFSDSWDNFSI